MSASLAQVTRKVEEFTIDLEKENLENKEMLRNNIVENCIEDFVMNNKVGVKYPLLKLREIYQEGDFRYKYNIPPGFCDMDKDKNDPTKLQKFGDLIVWKQILDHARTVNGDGPFWHEQLMGTNS